METQNISRYFSIPDGTQKSEILLCDTMIKTDQTGY